MKIKEVTEILNARAYTDNADYETEFATACASDLMSDVLAFVKDQALLLTGLLNAQVVRTAEMMDMKAVIFVRGKEPSEDIIKMANQKDIMLFTTEYPLYIACGKLFDAGLTGDGEGVI